MTLISEDIFDANSRTPTLLGGRSKIDGKFKFPRPTDATADDYDDVALKREGKLWSYTVQRFPPGSPFVGITDRDKFEPFAIGYVELKDQVIVETRIVTENFMKLKIGLPMSLVVETQKRGVGDGEFTTFAFTPTQELSL